VITVAVDHIGSVFCVCPPNPPGGSSEPWPLDYSIVGISWPAINWYQFQIDATNSNSFTVANVLNPRTGQLTEPDATSCYPASFPQSWIPLDGLPVAAIRQGVVNPPNNVPGQELGVVGSQTNVPNPSGTFHTDVTIPVYTTTVFWITEYTTAAPTAPQLAPPVVDPTTGNVVLQWQSAPDATFLTHQVYRDGALVFPPAGSSVVLRAAMWIETSPPPGKYTYHVVTVNASGNASPPSADQPVTVP
jgi:hypothetical protein